MQTNRHNSYCDMLRKRGQKREQKFRVEVTSVLQILNIQYKISSKSTGDVSQAEHITHLDGWLGHAACQRCLSPLVLSGAEPA